MIQILTLLMHVTKGKDWAGNKALQEDFTLALQALGLKANGHQRNPNPGGPRTYLSQLEGLGLVFVRDADQTLWPTIAGEALIAERAPLEVMQTQLLRYQYPSVYSKSRNVNIHPDVRVRPYRFLLSLILDPDLMGLSNEEFAVAVVYGHNHDCLSLCKTKILQLRQGVERIERIIDNPETDLVTPRTQEKRRIEQSWSNAWEDMKNVGNTFKNGLESNYLIVENPDTRRFDVEEESVAFVRKMLNLSEPFISVEDEESFQRAFGRFDREKDNRRLLAPEKTLALQDGSSVILAKFMAHCRGQLVRDIPEEWIVNTSRDLAISQEKVRGTVEPYMDRAISLFEQTYLDLSKGGSVDGLEFEKATAELFRKGLGFEVRLTGQLKRKEIGGYSDLLLVPDQGAKCAIIDTKASGNYALGSSDYHKMVNNYLRNYKELDPEKSLEFCGYVAGGFSHSFSARLKSLERDGNVPAIGLTAAELLRILREQPSENLQSRFREVCRDGGLVSSERVASVMK